MGYTIMGLLYDEIARIKTESQDYKTVKILETLTNAIQTIEERIDKIEESIEALIESARKWELALDDLERAKA